MVITLDEFQYYAPKLTGDTDGPPHSFRLRLKVFTDHDADGDLDASAVSPYPIFDQVAGNDFEKLFYATSGQLAVVDDRIRDDGNLMAGVRAFSKNKVESWNSDRWLEYNGSSSGEPEATHTDIDDDDPS